MLSMQDSVRFLKGVGDQRAKRYEKKGVDTIYSLLRFFPRQYRDFTRVTPIIEAMPGETCTVCGEVVDKKGPVRLRGGKTMYEVWVTDGAGKMRIVLYQSEYVYRSLVLGKSYHLFGRVSGTLLRREMTMPFFVPADSPRLIQAVYPQTEGLTSPMIASHMEQALSLWGDQLQDFLPEEVRREEQLCHVRFAYENIHRPESMQAMETARQRLIFEELFLLQLGLRLMRHRNRAQTAVCLNAVDLTPFLEALPFALTDSQRQAIDEALADLSRSVPMNRLLQGDVGAGKTMVACALAYAMAKGGYQTVIMAPTEILAAQHSATFSRYLEPLGIRCALLTGSLTAKEKNRIKAQVQAGEMQVLLGTHAVIQKDVTFANLGLVVTDEQHRFGVNQRASLQQKGENPHKLVMSATPIPRTLALMLYGDLDVSWLTTLPSGRLPVETYLIDEPKRNRGYGFLLQQIKEGGQVYIVCPLVEESDTAQRQAVTAYADGLAKTVLRDVRIGVLHGKLKAAEKERIMGDFQQGKLDILVCTTVIEVGVDVPNAVIMWIENAEQFGLSQLHQLRGRVGRGQKQSYCILMTGKLPPPKRLRVFCRCRDGFVIAQEDLKERGPGDFFGARQHGLPKLQIADMAEDMAVLQRTQYWAEKLLQEDPLLTKTEHRPLHDEIERLFSRQIDSA